MLHISFYRFFIKKVLQNSVGEILHLLTLSSKLIFWSALKKAFMVPGDRCYQKQYFAKIFPGLLASRLHIHCYFHLKKSSENALWITIALKSATFSFSAPEGAPETALETTYLCYFSKTWLKLWIKSWWWCLFW